MAIPNITVDGSDLISVVALQTKLRLWSLEKLMKQKKLRLTKQGKEAAKAGAEAAKIYVDEVMKLLGTIMGSETGAIILNAISASGKQLVIRPWMERQSNAWAWATDFDFAVQKGHPLFVRDDDETTPFVNESLIPGSLLDKPSTLSDYMGTGAGSDSVLEYTPALPSLTVFESLPRETASKPFFAQDQVLFHELTHAYRQTTGQQTRVPLIGNALKYDNTEEFFSVLVSNIYISENGGTILRGDHGDAVLRPELTKRGTFFGDSQEGRSNRAALALTKIDPAMFRKLAHVRSANFNPLRDLLLENKMKDALNALLSLNEPQSVVRTVRR